MGDFESVMETHMPFVVSLVWNMLPDLVKAIPDSQKVQLTETPGQESTEEKTEPGGRSGNRK